jgi:acetolactate synthase-1/2/3 large subunit
MTETNGAAAIAQAFSRAGMPAIFGVPGGGSSLDLIEAAKSAGIPFILARTENGAGIMASALAELTQRPVGLLVTRGPGVSNAANGMANAALERSPVIMVADGYGTAESVFATHQLFDQAAMLMPVTKSRSLVPEAAAGQAAADAIWAALAHPRGPAYIQLPGEAARAPSQPSEVAEPGLPLPPEAAVAKARSMLGKARHPVIVAGLEALDPARCAATRALAHSLGCPVLPTYKAKGVMPDYHPLFGGVFTGGAAEAPLLREADLILLLGADPVEFIAQPWRFEAPIIELATAGRALHYREPALSLTGAWDVAAEALAATAGASAWTAGAIAAHRDAWLGGLRNASGGDRGMAPSEIVEQAQAACREAGADPRVAVDAGAHMFSCTTFWQASRPGDLLISNGLATMGYALPAAIAAAWHDPSRGALAFTGDGGLLMALGELATAASLGLKLVVVVFNDAALSLIEIKKGQRDLPDGALDWPPSDFATVMRGLGGAGHRADDAASLHAAMREAWATPGPALIDVRCDPSSYPAQIAALRG